MKSMDKRITKRRYKVALLMETSNEYARGIIKGIYGYIKEHDQWDVYLGEYSRGEPNPEWLLSWKGDGIIARIENKEIAQLINLCGLPTVDTSSANLVPGIPWVETDDKKIAELAYGHLKGCGLKILHSSDLISTGPNGARTTLSTCLRRMAGRITFTMYPSTGK